MNNSLRYQILQYTANYPSATSAQIATSISANLHSVQADINALVKLGFLDRIKGDSRRSIVKYTISFMGVQQLKTPQPSQPDDEQLTAQSELLLAELALVDAEQRLADARKKVRSEFKEELVALYNKYKLHVTTSVDFEVTIETMSGTATVENQFGSDK